MTVGLGIVGCGDIALQYCRDISPRADMTLVGYHDIDRTRAVALAGDHGGTVFDELDELLEAPGIDVVVNLTIFEAHYEVVKRALEAGRHVYSEKPLALRYSDAAELLAIAEANGLRLACSPFVFLGEAQQAMFAAVDRGDIGTVRLVYAEVNHGRIEAWHSNPASFYAVGPMPDVGVYPLTLLTALFGPVARLSAYSATLAPERVDVDGNTFEVAAPDYHLVNLELVGGIVIRLTANFYVESSSPQGESVELHGDLGSIRLGSWSDPGTELELIARDGTATPIAFDGPPTEAFDWSIGLAEFVAAIAEERPSRVSAVQAAHIVEILDAAEAAAQSGGIVTLESSFEPPPRVT